MNNRRQHALASHAFALLQGAAKGRDGSRNINRVLVALVLWSMTEVLGESDGFTGGEFRNLLFSTEVDMSSLPQDIRTITLEFASRQQSAMAAFLIDPAARSKSERLSLLVAAHGLRNRTASHQAIGIALIYAQEALYLQTPRIPSEEHAIRRLIAKDVDFYDRVFVLARSLQASLTDTDSISLHGFDSGSNHVGVQREARAS